jgi:hypothetical protein
MDWVNVRWEGDDEEQEPVETPSQILCFFYFTTGPEPNELQALVLPCDVEHEDYSMLVKKWQLEEGYQIVSVECLQHHVCMFPFRRGSPVIYQFRDKCLWPAEFVGDDDIGDYEAVNELDNIHWD